MESAIRALVVPLSEQLTKQLMEFTKQRPGQRPVYPRTAVGEAARADGCGPDCRTDHTLVNYFFATEITPSMRVFTSLVGTLPVAT